MSANSTLWAFRFKHLLDTKNQYARILDASTKQLVQLIVSQSTSPAPASAKEYSPANKDVLQADLLSFSLAIFTQLSKTPSEFDKALKQQTAQILKGFVTIIQTGQ